MPELNEQTRRELRELIGRRLYFWLGRSSMDWEESSENVRERHRQAGDRVIDALIGSVLGELLEVLDNGHGTGCDHPYRSRTCRDCALYRRLTEPNEMLYPMSEGKR